MPKRLDPQQICQACLLNFRGKPLQDIASLLEVAPNTLSNWKKTKIWQDYEAKLIDEWHQENKDVFPTADAPPAR